MVVLCILEIVEDFMSLLREFEVFSAYALLVSGASIVLVSLTGFFVFSNDFPLILQVYLIYVFLMKYVISQLLFFIFYCFCLVLKVCILNCYFFSHFGIIHFNIVKSWFILIVTHFLFREFKF